MQGQKSTDLKYRGVLEPKRTKKDKKVQIRTKKHRLGIQGGFKNPKGQKRTKRDKIAQIWIQEYLSTQKDKNGQKSTVLEYRGM